MGGLATRARHIWRRVLHPELSAGLRIRIPLALFEIRYPGPEKSTAGPGVERADRLMRPELWGTGGGARIAKLNMLQNRSVPQCSATRFRFFLEEVD